MTGFEFTPAFADLEEANPFFETHGRLPESNKQAALEATNIDHTQGFEALLRQPLNRKNELGRPQSRLPGASRWKINAITRMRSKTALDCYDWA